MLQQKLVPSLSRNTRSSIRNLLIAAVCFTMLLAFVPSIALGVPHHLRAAPGPALTATPLVVHPVSAAPYSPSSFGHAPTSMPTPHLGNFNIPGPHPSSWGKAGIPPGWEAMMPSYRAHSVHSALATPTTGGLGSGPDPSNWNNRLCAGLWPGFPTIDNYGPQQAYAGNCYGHDEPGIQFYSNLAGSGGNVSWNVTLPVDRSPTLNQSNLYAAIWFGMALTDPLGWLGQCFLEVQFYPDQTFYNPGPMFPNITVNGAWIGAAVAWQIEAATGAENPCYYSPLYLNGTPGPAYLNMTQGDQLTVRMSGWQTSPTGELITIIDHTNGQKSHVRLFDTSGNFPLNPAYSTNSYPAAFQWTPGGEYPVAFAFETGHAGNTNWPSNNSFGGCSGGPTSTPVDPGAPCPSYDPGSWANDTLRPWHIDTPTFFNRHTIQTPTQVAFTQPEGGMDLVDQTSNGVCNSMEGAGWCSYPWYSYSCAAETFEFGATDYTGVSSDFGKYTQYDRVSQNSSLEIPFFPPINFSVPECGGATYTVTVSSATPGMGAVDFLSHQYTTATGVNRVSPGEYSLYAIPHGGASFSHWSTHGGATVAISTDPYTALTLSGTGSVSAVFTRTPATTTVTFRDVPKGFVGVDPTMFQQGDGSALANVYNGGTLALAPGIYPIQAYPAPGYNFTTWSLSGHGAQLAAPEFISTWLVITGQSTSVTVTAHYAASPDMSSAELYVIGSGTMRVGNLTVTNSGPGVNFGAALVPVGTYQLVLTPAPGTISTQFLYGVSVVISNFSLRTHVTLQNGSAVMEAIFTQGATVTFGDSPAAGGGISIQGAPGVGSSVMHNGVSATFPVGSYMLQAVPFVGYTFLGWSTSTPGTVSLGSTSSEMTMADFSGSGSVKANYVATSHPATVTFKTSPTTGGTIVWDLMNVYHSGHSNSSVALGQHTVSATAAVGWAFAGWNSTSKISVSAGAGSPTVISVVGSGTLTAMFVPATFAVTFVAFNPEGNPTPGAVIVINHQVVHTGDTMTLSWGTHTLQLFSEDALQEWTTSPGTAISSLHTYTVTITVHVAGTIYAILWDSDVGNDTGGNHVPFHGAPGVAWGSVTPPGLRGE